MQAPHALTMCEAPATASRSPLREAPRSTGRSAGPAWRVESGHEFTVGGAGGGEVFVAFVELLLLVDDLLFEMGDPLVE